MNDTRFTPALVQTAGAVLEKLRAASSSLALAVVLSDDGFEAVRTPFGTAEDGRFASMASSVQALGEAVVAELSAGEGEVVIVQASKGFSVQMRVPEQPYVIAAHFQTGDNLGTALVLVRTAAQELSDALAAPASVHLAPRYSAPIVVPSTTF